LATDCFDRVYHNCFMGVEMCNQIMTIHFIDRGEKLVAAWQEAFKGVSDVSIQQGDIFFCGVSADGIVSPANSFGIMDGGIDLAYSFHFGWGLQKTLQAEIKKQYSGELPVGCALVVPTYDPQIPWLISAPTMRAPCIIQNTDHVYLAFRAALLAAKAQGMKAIICPGLGTGVGMMEPKQCAKQMKMAYDTVLSGKYPADIIEAISNQTYIEKE
jgi:O-acetyl-ADP-ribose deacetylase (regulator of RNase III)